MKNENTTNPEAFPYTHVLNKKLQEFETWIKNVNYSLFLEYAHSNEYYKRKQLYLQTKN
ncbi:MAG TPA: hypothetical protein ACFYD4_12780 [Candidatus Wunengus sp. YC61]|uniref:hypothetical protein n=1 Tax=Candidatus Wunengus sp. YC61 TaxID=3367698 RepID=UPI0040267B34